MAKIPFSFGGGGGDSSDDCTATAADVLENKTAIYNGSEDDAASGSMKDYSGTSTSASVTNNSSSARVELTVPNTGKYDTAAKLYTPYSTLASAVSLTAAKIATGNAIMGVTGTYTGVGTAGASQVLSGYTFSNSSSSGISGTMTDKSGSTSSANSSLDSSNSRLRLQIPTTGYYNTSSYLYATYSNIASLIGLTAAKVKYGETILGITGTWNGYVATSTDLYYNGSEGTLCGTMATYDSGGSITKGSSCVTMTFSTGGSASYMCLGWPTTLNCGAYSTLKLTYNITSTNITTSSAYIAIALYTTRPTTATGFSTDNANKYASAAISSTGSSRTLSIDISGVSSNLYVGVVIYHPSVSYTVDFTAEVTRVQVS